jgi:hypothetical protein
MKTYKKLSENIWEEKWAILNNLTVIDEHENTVASCAEERDATLINAAPDMLAVLKAIGEFAKSGQPLHWGALITDSDDETAAETVLKVIAKAEGK